MKLLFEDNANYAVSAAISQDSFTFAVIRLSTYTVIHETTASHSAVNAELVFNHLLLFIKKQEIPTSRLLGIAVTVPTLFIKQNLFCNNRYTSWNSFVETISNYLNIPAYIETSAVAISLAELTINKDLSKKVNMVLNLGWELEMGLIINGNLYKGNDGLAGQFGYNICYNAQDGCSCEAKGCVNAFASLRAIQKNVTNSIIAEEKSVYLTQSGLSVQHIIDAANKGDQVTVSIIRKAAIRVGDELAKFASILTPDAVILSGLGALAGKAWLPFIQQRFNECLNPVFARSVNFAVSEIPDKAELLGGAILVERARPNITEKKQQEILEAMCSN